MIQLLVSPTANEESVNNPSVPPPDRRFHGIDRLVVIEAVDLPQLRFASRLPVDDLEV
jgi:hypothetical protein